MGKGWENVRWNEIWVGVSEWIGFPVIWTKGILFLEQEIRIRHEKEVGRSVPPYSFATKMTVTRGE